MEAPSWFVRELEAFDPDLRLRWSPRLELWQLERRVRRSLHPGTIATDGWHDDLIRARDGYLLVASVPPNGLGRGIFQKLRNSDLWSNGGWKKIADDLDAAEGAIEAKRDAQWNAEVRQRSAVAYDYIARREGRQVFNAGWVN